MALPKILHRHRDERQRDQRQQRQPRVDRDHQRQRRDERQHRVRRVHDRRADHHAHGVQVVGGARHQVAGPVRLEVRQRQLLQVREEVVPHVVLDVPRRADQDAAHQEAEDAADEADRNEQGRRTRPALRASRPASDRRWRAAGPRGPARAMAVVATTQTSPRRKSRAIAHGRSRAAAGRVTPNRV